MTLRHAPDRGPILFLAAIVVVALVAAGIVWWEKYKYNECRRVGHSAFYCLAKR